MLVIKLAELYYMYHRNIYYNIGSKYSSNNVYSMSTVNSTVSCCVDITMHVLPEHWPGPS